ncbi:MAG: hypothetical protein AB7O32_12390 [Vicinamibacterales bacterium]
MWARVAESMLGMWLVLSPFIFRNTDSLERFIAIDMAAGSAVVLLSLLSFWHRTARAHFVTLALALSLGLYAYFAWERPGPPAAQNEITLAIMIALLALIPNEANLPAKPWRERTEGVTGRRSR